jgi:hypothetical protein
LKTGYGLSNYWNIREGFVYHGHNGGVEGGLTEMAYMPDYGVGYFYSINAGSGSAFEKVGKAICAYITRGLKKPELPSAAALPPDAAEYAGWYEANSPRVEMIYFLERLLGIAKARFADGKLHVSSLGEWDAVFVPVGGGQFRKVPKEGPADPAPSVALMKPNEEGRFIQAGSGMLTMKQIPAWLAIAEIALMCWFVLAVAAVLLYSPFWILGGLSKKRRRPAERAMRWWPLLAVVSLLAVIVVFMLASDDLISRMGHRTGWSMALFLATVAFAVAAVLGAVAVWRAPKEEVRTGVRRFSMAVTLALVVAAAYFAYWGFIGLRTWA